MWLTVSIAVSNPTPLAASIGSLQTANVLIFIVGVGLSVPAVALFGSGQIVGDVRIMRNNSRQQAEHLAAMQRYYEPQARC